MPAAATMTDRWSDGKRLFVTFSVALTGSYTTNGDTLDLSAFAGIEPPVYVEAHSSTSATNSYNFTVGTSTANGKLIAAVSGVQVGAGAYPAGLTGDTISGLAIFKQSM